MAFLQVPTTGVLRSRQKSTKNLVQGGRVECWRDILSVSIWQETIWS